MDTEKVHGVVKELGGLTCERAENPHGSILSIDLGPLDHRPDDPPTARTHGWRHLTVLSPWRIQSEQAVICDWNVDGGLGGGITRVLQKFVGERVIGAETAAPAWDLRLTWSNGLMLFVFGDTTDEREDAWFILGTDGVEVAGIPIVQMLEA